MTFLSIQTGNTSLLPVKCGQNPALAEKSAGQVYENLRFLVVFIGRLSKNHQEAPSLAAKAETGAESREISASNGYF
jgi:hypothetical protein